MSKVERIQGAAHDETHWWAGAENAPDDNTLHTLVESYTERDGATAMDKLSNALQDMDDATRETDATVADAARWMAEHLATEDLVATVVLVQDLRRRLGLVESYLAREAGHLAVEVNAPREGVLPDGRLYTLRRGANRKAWDHDTWKHDVRAQVLATRQVPAELVDPDTGDLVNLPTLLAAVQEVHGSTAPRVTGLKGLGLDPGDYCETTPGPWTVQAVAKTETIQENDK